MLKGFSCCSDQLIGVHYMEPKEVIRLDIAIELENNAMQLYNSYYGVWKRTVSFKDVFKFYVLLQDFESNSNSFMSYFENLN